MRKKVLFSWLGTEKDLINQSVVNTNGPTWNLYKYHLNELEFDLHVLLVTEKFRLLGQKFKERVEQEFNAKVELRVVPLTGVHYNLRDMLIKLSKMLLEYKDDFIYIFLSTGSGVMKIAWYLLHTSLSLDSKIIQIIRSEETKSGESEIVYLDIKKSQVPYWLMVREETIEKEKKEAFLTPTLEKVYRKADFVAETDNVSVLIIGETGTGKEYLARYIHQKSVRRDRSFRAINCSAFSDQLLESRLFGYAKGSFTGAYKDTKGLFEEADKGTVFLDEIGDISPYMQQVLLRFLQEKEIQPIGKKPKMVDVRIIAATNKTVEELLYGGYFRSDLFYRLGIILQLPPFREYPMKEKMQIFEYFLQKKAEFYGRKKLKICKELEMFLATYSFPGNFRELDTIIDNLYIFSQQNEACIENLPYYINKPTATATRLKDIERQHIIKVYNMFDRVKKKTAEALGISLNTLKNKLKEYGME